MTHPRSYLFVPGDAPRKMAKALDAGADALILDLEDSVAPANKDTALRETAAFLAERPGGDHAPALWVRVNAAEPARALAEAAALPLARLAGIVHPKLEARAQLKRMGDWLDALEARDGVAAGGIGLIGIVTETPAAMVGRTAASLADGHPRLRGYAWGTEDLSAALGRAPLAGVTDAQSALARAAQEHCLLLAGAAGIDAIDGVATDLRDHAGLGTACDLARELGFVAKLAIHPAQVEPINAAMTPDAATVDWARRVIALTEAQPESAALSLDGRMIDQPHITIARRIVARADG